MPIFHDIWLLNLCVDVSGENQYNISILVVLHISYFKKYVLGKEDCLEMRFLSKDQTQSLKMARKSTVEIYVPGEPVEFYMLILMHRWFEILKVSRINMKVDKH